MTGRVGTFVPTVVVVLLLLAPADVGVYGQTEEDPCAPEATRSSQLMACAGRQFRAAEAEMKLARAALYRDSTPRSRVKHRAAERVWLRYRKANCEAEAAHYEGGTIQPLIELRCMTRVTLERTSELREQSETRRG